MWLEQVHHTRLDSCLGTVFPRVLRDPCCVCSMCSNLNLSTWDQVFCGRPPSIYSEPTASACRPCLWNIASYTKQDSSNRNLRPCWSVMSERITQPASRVHVHSVPRSTSGTHVRYQDIVLPRHSSAHDPLLPRPSCMMLEMMRVRFVIAKAGNPLRTFILWKGGKTCV